MLEAFCTIAFMLVILVGFPYLLLRLLGVKGEDDV